MRAHTPSTQPQRQSLVTIIEHMSDEQRLAYLRQHFAQYHRLTPREVRAFRRRIWWQQRVWSRLPSDGALLFGYCVALWLGTLIWSLVARW